MADEDDQRAPAPLPPGGFEMPPRPRFPRGLFERSDYVESRPPHPLWDAVASAPPINIGPNVIDRVIEAKEATPSPTLFTPVNKISIALSIQTIRFVIEVKIEQIERKLPNSETAEPYKNLLEVLVTIEGHTAAEREDPAKEAVQQLWDGLKKIWSAWGPTIVENTNGGINLALMSAGLEILSHFQVLDPHTAIGVMGLVGGKQIVRVFEAVFGGKKGD